jgi:tetratricopeptide (TPR) repeat protein
MTLEPPRRTFKEPAGKDSGRGRRLKDVDAVARAEKLRVAGWALFAGLPMGGMAGYAAGNVLAGLVLGPVFVFVVASLILAPVNRTASLLHMPSGSSTPRRKEHSQAEALAVRGDFEAAIALYEEAIRDVPEDGEAYLRIARIHRDHLESPEEALHWFRRATDEAELPHGQEMLARREMAELLIHRLREPRRAAPDLARLAEAHEGKPEGDWAREELARIKEEMARGE